MTSSADNRFKPSSVIYCPPYEKQSDFVLWALSHFADGELIYKGRNELRRFSHDGKGYVIKSFHKPNFLNRLVYGFLRTSKAYRSFFNALQLRHIGVGTPPPVAFAELHDGLLFGESYYMTLASECPYTYNDLFYKDIPYQEQVLREVGRITALMHSHGLAHLDYGRGNILFGMKDGKVCIELVDLNRMRSGRPLGLKAGCKNFERLPATPQMHRWMAEEYAKARGFDAERCFELMERYRSTQPGKIDGKY